MLQNTKDLYGHKLIAKDGEIGHITDFYFDDQHWTVRYLVADTGSWLGGRAVLLSPHAFGQWDEKEKTLSVDLTRKQIQNSPPIERHQPVSRQQEIDYYQYYGWPAYWNGGAVWGLGGFPVVMPASQDQIEAQGQPQHRKDKHLRSTKAIHGYSIHATDGEIGSVKSFIVDDKSWQVSQLSVEAGHWYAGQEIFITPSSIDRISYDDSSVFVKLTTDDIRHTAEHHVAKAED